MPSIWPSAVSGISAWEASGAGPPARRATQLPIRSIQTPEMTAHPDRNRPWHGYSRRMPSGRKSLDITRLAKRLGQIENCGGLGAAGRAFAGFVTDADDFLDQLQIGRPPV